MKDCCSFFSAARRTNQEALPQLSGLSARRLGRRRGLRNSLRSNSPRPFSSVFLATLPPDKGGINQSFFRFYSTFFFQSPRPADTSPIFPNGNTGEEGEIQYFCSTVVSTPSPYGHSPYIPLRKHPVRPRGTAGERLRCIPLSPLLRFYEPCSTMLRGTAGGRG